LGVDDTPASPVLRGLKQGHGNTGVEKGPLPPGKRGGGGEGKKEKTTMLKEKDT